MPIFDFGSILISNSPRLALNPINLGKYMVAHGISEVIERLPMNSKIFKLGNTSKSWNISVSGIFTSS